MESSEAFSNALQLDPNLPSAWAAWGEYNDLQFNAAPHDLKYAADAINCYLHAAAFPTSKRPRQYIARVLWLISLDDEQGTLQKAYESFKGEIPIWHWVAFIPQLLTSLAGRESKITRGILTKLAKAHPQALHFQLKTAKADMNILRKNQYPSSKHVAETINNEMSDQMSLAGLEDESKASDAGSIKHDPNNPTTPVESVTPTSKRMPWEVVDEISGLLKTAFPLLALSMEAMTEQMLQRLKPTADEDIYRLVTALLNDGVQVSYI